MSTNSAPRHSGAWDSASSSCMTGAQVSSNVCNSEPNAVINGYNTLTSSERQDLLNFLRSL